MLCAAAIHAHLGTRAGCAKLQHPAAVPCIHCANAMAASQSRSAAV
jgi:hypothetical protein